MVDPAFFLHHTQVDRLWWLWQQADLPNRQNDFAGAAPGGGSASLTDILPMYMSGFAADRHVADFMSTVSDDLCYTY